MSTESFKVNIPFSKGAEVVLAKERHDFSETAIVESKKTFLGHLISFIPSKLLDTLGINHTAKISGKTIMTLCQKIKTLSESLKKEKDDFQTNLTDLNKMTATLLEIMKNIKENKLRGPEIADADYRHVEKLASAVQMLANKVGLVADDKHIEDLQAMLNQWNPRLAS